MSELWLRIGLIAAAVAIAMVAALVTRRARSPRPALLEADLGPGIYLFSSSDCLDCRSARSVIEQALGPRGFVEIRWEEDPGIFDRLGISAVPTTLVVSAAGSATLYPGMPDAAIRAFNP
jgi:hypothetical protein